MIKDKIDIDLLVKYAVGQASEEEKVKILNWVRSSSSNGRFLNSFLWNFAKSRVENSEFRSKSASSATHIGGWGGFKRINRLLVAATIAGITILSVAGILLTNYFAPSLITVVAQKGERKNIVLNDGTKVLLAPDSKFVYPESFSGKKRCVTLDGEAFFDVAHDDSKSFIVTTGNSRITVLGTKFNVKAYSSDILSSATLVSGSVQVQFFKSKADNDGRTEILKPSQKAVYNVRNNRFVISDVDIDEEIAWQSGRYVFNNKCFGDIAKDLERIYNVSITIGSAELLNRRFTGEFSDETIEYVLETFKEWTNINYVIKDSVIYVNQLPM